MQFDQTNIKTKDVDNVFKMIGDELEIAIQKHPLWPADPLHAIGIIMEEAGEAAKDAVQWTYELHKLKDGHTLKKELIQTAATCIRMICGLDSGDIKPT